MSPDPKCARPRHGRRAPVAALTAFLLAAAACSEPERKPIVFGLAGPFRTEYGVSMQQGAELARRDINQAGGIRNRLLEFRVVDDAADADSASRVAESLFRDPAVVAVVGHANSSTTVQAAGTYDRGLPAVATSATSPEISRLGDWVFRVAPSDSDNSVQLARFAHRLGLPTGILYQNEDYGRGLADGFRRAMLDAGGRVLETDPYLPETQDLAPYLERMKTRGVKLVFIAGMQADAARIIRQAHAVGLDARFLGGDGLERLARKGPEFEGTMLGLLFHPDASPAAGQFADRFRAAFHHEPDSFAALGYDATRLLAVAAAEGGPSRASIRGYLARVGREGGKPAYEGVTGTIRFDENGDPVKKEIRVGSMRAGKIILDGEG
jgi:branched-chain amino acid transport system substrate-binding protein